MEVTGEAPESLESLAATYVRCLKVGNQDSQSASFVFPIENSCCNTQVLQPERCMKNTEQSSACSLSQMVLGEQP